MVHGSSWSVAEQRRRERRRVRLSFSFGSDFGSRSRQSAGRRAHVLLPTDKAGQSRAEQSSAEQSSHRVQMSGND